MNTNEIQDWLITQIAGLINTAPENIDIHESFSNYGLSSLNIITLSGDLEVLLHRRLSPTLAYDYPNILLLSRYLAEEVENDKSAPFVKTATDFSAEPIAVIGISCRFPGAKNPEAFWQLLRNGGDAISEVPADRWKKQAFYHPDPATPGKAVSYWGGFLENIDQFDPFFFGISPMEAKYMDPQQRLVLELSYEALDDAGQVTEQLNNTKAGVFVGISVNEYSLLQFADPLQITGHSGTGSALSIAANRISYFFNFHGPSIAIDTACSSSLSAVHLACKSIRDGECSMALAGGVNIILSPAHSIAFTKAGVLAPDGRCKTFDAKANGYVRGEGGGVVVLKPLSLALADGDPVHALIVGSAMCQDGRTNGLIAPNRDAQEAMLREAYGAAGISPGSVQYVEAHGTGTLLGDAIEAQALGAVVGANRMNGPCAIGSVKSNIGHLESAAGIAGLIKVILSLEHHTIPPSIHYYSPNPHIPFDELNLRVQNELSSWPSHAGTAIAGVSSFGFGGTNVHVVVQEAGRRAEVEKDNQNSPLTENNCQILPLSANSPEALYSYAGTFLNLLTDNPAIATRDICYAASVRRSMFNYRLAAIGNSRQELCEGLQSFLHGKQSPYLITGSKELPRRPRLAFVFPGQGGQWLGMGRGLLKTEPVFYQAIQRIDDIIQAEFAWSLMDTLRAEQKASALDEIDVIQPALFAIQVALAALWQSWGILPDAVAGHSMGEVAAAHIAGILSLEDAIRVVCCRSQLLKKLRGKGSMLATELSPAQAKELLRGYGKDIAIAVINGPASTVLSGAPEAIKEVMDTLQRQNTFCKLVNVDVASHSPQIDQLRSELLKALEGLDPQPAKIPFYSTVTGALSYKPHFNADYWMDNLRKPVLFSDAVRQLLDKGHSIFIEIGPHPVLLGSIQQLLQPHHRQARLLPSLRREEQERGTLLKALGGLYTDGFSIAWSAFCLDKGKYVHLPLIPWQRQRYWIDTIPANPNALWHPSPIANRNYHPLLGAQISLANSPSFYVWQTTLNDEVFSFLKDHRIGDEIMFPAAGYIEMALQAAEETGLNKSHELADFYFREKLVLQNRKPATIQTLLSPAENGSLLFSIHSRTSPEENWKLHASVTFLQKEFADGRMASEGPSPEVIQQQSTSQFTAQEFYKILQSRGVQYGPEFRAVQHIWYSNTESLGMISLPESLQIDSDVYQIHPVLLDACLQVLAATQGASGDYSIYLPNGCRYIRFFSHPGQIRWSHVSLLSGSLADADVLNADIRLLDDNGQTIAELIGFRLQRTSRHFRHLLSLQDSWLYHLYWQVQERSYNSPNDFLEKKHWLIFADKEGLGEELAKQLKANGDSCYLLPCDETIKRLESTQEDTLIEIIGQLLEKMPSPLYGVIHLWSLSMPSLSPDGIDTTDSVQILGCNSVLLLVQALKNRIAGMPRMWIVTRGAQPVKSGESIAVEQSPLWGLGKVISFEFPETKCTRVDIDPNQSNAEAVPLLYRQIFIDDREDQVAFRAGTRFVLRLLPFSLSKSSSRSAASLRADSTYLITGGLGGLGLATAEWMVQQGARHLVLLGRSKPSPSAMTRVEKMRQEGVAVAIMQADASNPAQLEQVFKVVESHMPMLRGVIHAAGVLDDGSLLNLDTIRMKNVMAPKVDGTWNLHIATLNVPLDFFVLYSSAVSVLGSPGQGNYAAASAYLDAMAYYRRSLGLPAISINWGPWAEVGLAAVTTEMLKEQKASTQHLIKVIKVEQGLEILKRLLYESTPQVMVLPFDLKNLIQLYPKAAEMPFLEEVGSGQNYVTQLYARPNLRQQYVAPRNDIERKFAELWRQTLHIDRVGIHDSFFELGGDSVLAAQILSLAQKAFGVRINPQDAFKGFTIERLANMLEAEIISQIEGMSEEEAQRLLSMNN